MFTPRRLSLCEIQTLAKSDFAAKNSQRSVRVTLESLSKDSSGSTWSRRSFFKSRRNHFCVKSRMNRNRRVRFTSSPSHLLSTGSWLRKRRTKVDRTRFREARRLEERLYKKPRLNAILNLHLVHQTLFPTSRMPGFC